MPYGNIWNERNAHGSIWHQDNANHKSVWEFEPVICNVWGQTGRY